MYLRDIYINGFGRFSQTSITFHEGINLICGSNETGKTTLHHFLTHMLFGLERSRGRASRFDEYRKYTPWQSSAGYGGSLRIIKDNISYLVERNFDSSNKSFNITNEQNGRTLTGSQDELEKILGGITEEAFKNTISIGQLKYATNRELTNLLKTHMINLESSASSQIDVVAALSFLNEQKKAIQGGIRLDAVRELSKVMEEIRACEQSISVLRENANLFSPDNSAETFRLEQTLGECRNQRDELSAESSRWESYLNERGFKNASETLFLKEQIVSSYQRFIRQAEETDKPVQHWMPERLNIPVAGSGGALLLALIFIFTGHPFVGALFCLGALTPLIFLLATPSQPEEYVLKEIPKDDAQFLRNIFKQKLNTEEINAANYERLINGLDDCLELFERLEANEKEFTRLTNEIEHCQERLKQIKEEELESAKLFWEIDQIQNRMSSWESSKNQFEEILRDNERLNKELEAVNIAIHSITALTARMHETFAPRLNKAIAEALNYLTHGEFGEIYVSEDMDITFNTGTRTVPLESLSQGTIEQVYLALRISAAGILYHHTDYPLIFDDTFSMYDDNRLSAALELIYRTRHGQTLIFSCQDRERKLLDQMEIPYHYLSLDEL